MQRQDSIGLGESDGRSRSAVLGEGVEAERQGGTARPTGDGQVARVRHSQAKSPGQAHRESCVVSREAGDEALTAARAGGSARQSSGQHWEAVVARTGSGVRPWPPPPESRSPSKTSMVSSDTIPDTPGKSAALAGRRDALHSPRHLHLRPIHGAVPACVQDCPHPLRHSRTPLHRIGGAPLHRCCVASPTSAPSTPTFL